jgi:uncharacterized membrane protein YdfJ with MMPL/SSD domain
MHERPGAGTEDGLRHALRVSGRAVVFATLINAAGFLGLSVSRFPPLRQFGLLTAAAFALALIGDFTILPAALWIASRDHPRPPGSPALREVPPHPPPPHRPQRDAARTNCERTAIDHRDATDAGGASSCAVVSGRLHVTAVPCPASV